MAYAIVDLWQHGDGNVQSPSDPSGLYHSIGPTFEQRLPLRNLHWNSTSRPLRSISSLHIDLVPDTKTASAHRPSSTGSLHGTANDGQVPPAEASSQQRRHQIPGLRKTPYLKIYLVECEDVDTYRGTTRKELRDWVKDHTPSSQSSTAANKQDNHDAFEWLIVQVVPSSTNSSRPSSNAKGEADVGKKVTSSRWPSRTSTSVIEKIRADFNGTSKAAIDRVAQIQIAGSTNDVQTEGRLDSQDGKNGWDDMIFKMKSLILASFDLRVRRYEEDIKEKELQRNLPGWNFNTFFILKEGLARGFESVGLIEDALTDYRELAAGLYTTINEHALVDAAETQAAPFKDCTDDLREAYERAAKSLQDTQDNLPDSRQERLDLGCLILDVDRKPFRDLILANTISIFDFQCYVFARQVSLLSRLASADIKDDNSSDTTETSKIAGPLLTKPSDQEPENLFILAEICQLSLDFITSTAHSVRQDIRASQRVSAEAHDTGLGLKKSSSDDIVEDLVASWVFSACETILCVTAARSLSSQIDPPLRQLKHTARSGRANKEHASQDMGATNRKRFPDRSSSLPSHTPKQSIDNSFTSLTSLDAMRLLPPGTPHAGSHELAAQRGDLFGLSRRTLDSLAYHHRGWQGGLTNVALSFGGPGETMQEVELSDDSQEESTPSSNTPSQTPYLHQFNGIGNKSLFSALRSREDYYAAHEEFTALALAHYVVGERSKMAEGMTADLAVIRFRLGDYGAAASYFKQLAPFYNDRDWLDLGVTMLDMWAQCLRRLDQPKNFIPIAMRTLASHNSRLSMTQNTTWSLRDLITASASLDDQIAIPMRGYFTKVSLSSHLHHHHEHDGFQLALQATSLLPESFKAQSIRLRIVSLNEADQCDLWVVSEAGQEIEPGMNQMLLGSRMMRPGWYALDKVLVQVQNLLFVYDPSSPPEASLFPNTTPPIPLDQEDDISRKRILIWAHSRSLGISISHSDSIHLSEPRSILIRISGGQKATSKGRLLLRPGSAGLRLRTAESDIINGDATLDRPQPGIITFGVLAEKSSLSIKVPYSLENDLRDIIIGVEIDYTTEDGDFTFISNEHVSIILPLAVNVQDIFKQDALFSKFTIGTATSVPLRVKRCCIEGNSDIDVVSSPLGGGEIDVFAHQSLSLVSKISYKSQRLHQSSQELKARQKRLYLQIEFYCLDEEIRTAIVAEMKIALKDEALERYSRVLIEQLEAVLRCKFTMQDLETIALLREVELGSFEEYKWEGVLQGLPPEQSRELQSCLRDWHQQRKSVLLGGNVPPTQHLTVPVDIPEMKIVHTVRFSTLDEIQSPNPEYLFAIVGQVMPMELSIKYTQRWAHEKGNTAAMDFWYEVHANPDTWLVGGQRKARFSLKEDELVSFAVLFLPQRTGHLLYPSIEIGRVCADENTIKHVDQENPAQPDMSCETDYLNQGETIFVAEDLASTTVSLDPSGSSGGAWLVESKSR